MWFLFDLWMQYRAAFPRSTLSRTRPGTRPAWTTTTRPFCWSMTGVLDAEEGRLASGPSWRTTSPTSAQASGVRNLLQVLSLMSELTSCSSVSMSRGVAVHDVHDNAPPSERQSFKTILSILGHT